jgi:uncharacterized protein YycO
MARGDLVLFKTQYNPLNISAMIITWGTKGPFVHVAIDTGDGVVGALSSGIVYTAQANVTAKQGADGYIIPVVKQFGHPLDVEAGIEWVRAQVGKPYGWTDIISDGMKLLGLPWYIREDGHYDCSDLAARYLEKAGYILPQEMSDNTNQISPNDLARLFGVLDAKGNVNYTKIKEYS